MLTPEDQQIQTRAEVRGRLFSLREMTKSDYPSPREALELKQKAEAAQVARQQAAYQARPYLVMWRDSHAQIPCRFDTFDQAFEYAQTQWRRIKRQVDLFRDAVSWYGSDLTHSYIEGLQGRVRLCDYMLCDDVSNH